MYVYVCIYNRDYPFCYGSFLGGPSVVAIVFMDIENIHVMRSSLYRLRENLLSGNLAMSDAASGTVFA